MLGQPPRRHAAHAPQPRRLTLIMRLSSLRLVSMSSAMASYSSRARRLLRVGRGRGMAVYGA